MRHASFSPIYNELTRLLRADYADEAYFDRTSWCAFGSCRRFHGAGLASQHCRDGTPIEMIIRQSPAHYGFTTSVDWHLHDLPYQVSWCPLCGRPAPGDAVRD